MPSSTEKSSPQPSVRAGLANPLLRNVAIIAHVDHGKTTLVDALLHQSGIFRANERVAERVMDSNELERERGITILAKNTAVHYDDVLDQHRRHAGPRRLRRRGRAHAVDGRRRHAARGRVRGAAAADALRAAQGARAPACRRSSSSTRSTGRTRGPQAVLNEVYDLFIDLDATEDQLDFPVLYTNARRGTATPRPGETPATDLRPLFDAVVEHIPPPRGIRDAPLQALVANLDSSDYLGRLAIGRIFNGRVRVGDPIAVCKLDGIDRSGRWSRSSSRSKG